MKRNIFLFFLPFFLSAFFPLYSQNITGGHRGNITALIHNNDHVLSAGEDGFLVTWNVSARNSIDRFQLTTYRIQSMVKHPGKEEICIIENSGTGYYRVSVWNYRQKRKLFSKNFSKPVTYINYSASGNFIIASGLNNFFVTILNSSTGVTIREPDISSGNTVLALTNRSERNIMIYQSQHNDFSGGSIHTGRILYYDLDSMSVMSSFETPGNLLSPIVFGNNNNFLAGLNHEGLQLIHATSGRVLDSRANISSNALLFPINDDFYCVDRRGEGSVLFRFNVNRNGQLVERQQVPLSFDGGTISAFTSTLSNTTNMVFATSNRNFYHLGQQNRINAFNFGFQKDITEIAVGKNSIGFLSGNGNFSLLPVDFNSIIPSFEVKFAEHSGYNKITYLSIADEDHYLLWQTENASLAPLLLSAKNNESLEKGYEPRSLNILMDRFPIQSVSATDTRLLTLDNRNNISVRSIESILRPTPPARADFSFSAPGANDAVFINNENFMISRIVIGSSSPFLSVNTRTNETIPYFFPSIGGMIAYSANNGSTIYGAAIEHADIINTIFLNLSVPVQQRLLYRYPGEATNISIRESQGRLIIVCENDGVVIIQNENIRYFQRTRGLPIKLFNSANGFICLDTEGNISWHDNNGSVLASFRVFEDKWILSAAREISGRITQ